ncbi:MAG TPA: hypothetical protein VKA70_22375 [Blastocatellia bacterium]|nr:hypothetical protein [Blastocatellia bacterium]
MTNGYKASDGHTPYKGLTAYSEQDALFFFGRERIVRIIVNNMFLSRVLVLYGATGVGKSSVLRASVMGSLRQRDDLIVVHYRDWYHNPVSGLKSAVAEAVEGETKMAFPPPAAASLGDYLSECAERAGRELMIILDQFEEFFLYQNPEEKPGSFAFEFTSAVSRDMPVSFLISIREDTLSKLDRFKDRIPDLFSDSLRLRHLNLEEARAAIEGPIQRYNSIHGTSIRIEPELVDAVLEQVRTGQVSFNESGRGEITRGNQGEETAKIETPFLQLVMMRIWNEEMRSGSEVLRLSTLANLGGARLIVRTHLDGVLAEMTDSDRGIAAQIFNFLVTPSGTKIAHTVKDLSDYAAVKEEELKEVLEALSSGDNRILRRVAPSPDGPLEPRYEIFHDVLAPAILSWRERYMKAKDEKDIQREIAKMREQQDAEAARLAAHARARRLRWTVAVMAIGLILLAGVSTYAFVKRGEARTARNEAIKERDIAQAATGEAEKQTKIAEEKTADAELQTEALRKQRDATLEARSEAEQAWSEARKSRDIARAAEKKALDDREAARQARADATAARTQADNSRKEAQKEREAAEVASAEAEKARNEATLSRIAAQQAEENSFKNQQVAAQARAEAEKAKIDAIDSRTAAGKAEAKAKELEKEAQRQLEAIRTLGRAVRYNKFIMDAHTGVVNKAVPSKDGRSIVTAGADKVAVVWDYADESKPPVKLTGHLNAVNDADFSPDGKFVVTASDDKRVIIFDVASGARIRSMSQHRMKVNTARFSHDGEHIVTSSDDDTAKIWSRKNGSVRTLDGHKEDLNSAVFSPDGKYVVTSSDDDTARIWVAETGAVKAVLDKHENNVNSAVFSHDGDRVLTSSGDKTAKIWDLSGNLVRSLQGHKDAVNTAAFSQDDKYVVTASDDATAKVWEASTGHKLIDLDKHKMKVNDAAFSSDGKLVVTACADGYARVWERSSGKLVAQLLHTGPVLSAAFISDSKLIVTASADKRVQVWDISSPPNSQ